MWIEPDPMLLGPEQPPPAAQAPQSLPAQPSAAVPAHS